MSDDKKEKGWRNLLKDIAAFEVALCLIRFFCTSRARILRHIVDGGYWRDDIGGDNTFHKIKMR